MRARCKLTLAPRPLRDTGADDRFAFWRSTRQAGTPFAGGTFRMKVTFPADYPFMAFRVIMLTKMFHPNIDGGGRVAYPGDVVRDPGKRPTLACPA